MAVELVHLLALFVLKCSLWQAVSQGIVHQELYIHEDLTKLTGILIVEEALNRPPLRVALLLGDFSWLEPDVSESLLWLLPLVGIEADEDIGDLMDVLRQVQQESFNLLIFEHEQLVLFLVLCSMRLRFSVSLGDHDPKVLVLLDCKASNDFVEVNPELEVCLLWLLQGVTTLSAKPRLIVWNDARRDEDSAHV